MDAAAIRKHIQKVLLDDIVNNADSPLRTMVATATTMLLTAKDTPDGDGTSWNVSITVQPAESGVFPAIGGVKTEPPAQPQE